MKRGVIIKAFTQDPARGNPAVVIDGPIDSPETLQSVREAECPVAAVVDTSIVGNIPIRFFYEHGATEVYVCGHATLAAALVALPAGEKAVSGKFMNGKGDVIEITRFADGKISQSQPIPEFRKVNIPEEALTQTLGIGILRDLPVELVGFPKKKKLLIPVKLKDLLSIERDFKAIRKLCETYSDEEDPITGLFPFALDVSSCDAHARHFPNRDEEDLVCGIGSVALVEYLRKHLNLKQEQFVIRCGPGEEGVGDVIVRMKEENGERKMYVEGYAVLA